MVVAYRVAQIIFLEVLVSSRMNRDIANQFTLLNQRGI